MKYDFTDMTICAKTADEKKAAFLFADEIRKRTGCYPEILADVSKTPCAVFVADKKITDRDTYKITLDGGIITMRAKGIRGLIYASGCFLRKSEYDDTAVTLTEDITGVYTPDKKIRGHQIGYRPCSNTYDAWNRDAYSQYTLELMYFGMNTVEHIPYEKGESNRNVLMRYDEEEFLTWASGMADTFDLDVSLWYPNSEDDIEAALKNRKKVFSACPRINNVFVPGGDPGNLQPDELFKRCVAFSALLKKYHPKATLMPSAQMPHEYPDWGAQFINEAKKLPSGIDGVITGPNNAYGLDELRRRLPTAYPIRFYPDITHNVRCEYPVHFERDDWHYALAAALGRESINPRPAEYKKIHSLTRRYVTGSVSYSDGVNDDVNKAVWSALDFNPDAEPDEILCDYARLFFPGANTENICNAILGLEKNWEGAPDINPQIEYTLELWRREAENNPSLSENWRFVQGLFRAECDVYVRRKLIFEKKLLKKVRALINSGELRAAENTLRTPFDSNIIFLRDEIEILAKKLFELIGMQLDTRRYFAQSWERGATLETIDLPITDKPWLREMFKRASAMPVSKAKSFMRRAINRNTVEKDELYFSVALNGLDALGTRQTPGFYMDFQGDRPDKNNGLMPVCMQKLYDHYSLNALLGGFSFDTDYVLTVTYKNPPRTKTRSHRVTVNGVDIYKGTQFGGERNHEFEEDMLPDGYVAVMYKIPASLIENGCIKLSITEPHYGFEICEFRITKTPWTREDTK